MGVKMWTQQQTLRMIGCAGVGAALLAVAGDELSQYSPQGYAVIADVERALPFWRLLTGEMLGVLGIPLCLLGYWCVCRVMQRGGIKGARAMFRLMAFGLVMGVVSHAIVSSAYTVMQAGSTTATDNLQLAADIPGILFLTSYLGVSGWYFGAVISGRTLYSRWMAFANPFLLSLLIALLYATNVLPPVMNVLFPAWLSVPHLIFFTLSTLVLWNIELAQTSLDTALKQPGSFASI